MFLKKIKIPGALVLVFILLLIVALLTWFIPTSVVVNENGDNTIIYNAAMSGDGEIIRNAGTSPVGFLGAILAIIKGFQESSPVGFAILMSGSFLALLNYTGALNASINILLTKFTGNMLIAILMLVFALMGAVYGIWEELPAYTLVIIPLFIAAGYDVLTGIAVIIIGATLGNMASVINPYSTGAAVAAIGNENLSLGSGITLRIVIFAALYLVGVFNVIRYANKVKRDPSKSEVYNITNSKNLENNQVEIEKFNKKHFMSILVFILIVVFLILGYIPWNTMKVGDKTMYDIVNAPIYALAKIPFIGNLIGASYITPLGDWYFDEFATSFLIGSILVTIINKISLNDFTREFINGAKGLLSVILVLAVARGMAIIMGSSKFGISVTLVYWIQNALSGVPIWGFAIAVTVAYLCIGIFLQSTSGVAAITMPILGAVAAALFVHSSAGSEGGQIVLISAFTVGINFMCAIYPGATVMGMLDMVNVPYNVFLKFTLKHVIPLLIISILILSIAPLIGLV